LQIAGGRKARPLYNGTQNTAFTDEH
jgi:hypothetical protein